MRWPFMLRSTADAMVLSVRVECGQDIERARKQVEAEKAKTVQIQNAFGKFISENYQIPDICVKDFRATSYQFPVLQQFEVKPMLPGAVVTPVDFSSQYDVRYNLERISLSWAIGLHPDFPPEVLVDKLVGQFTRGLRKLILTKWRDRSALLGART
jgi:hypothetical protein